MVAMTKSMQISSEQIATARLATSWLLWYPDENLISRVDEITQIVQCLPEKSRLPLENFLGYLNTTPISEIQAHYVAVFDMKRRACPYLTYWTDGDTRNRGGAILKFKQAYLESGFDLGSEELADHLSVVLEFAAVGNSLTGDALLTEHQGPINLLHAALLKMNSMYAEVVEAVLATLPEMTPELARRMEELAAAGPPVEHVGLEPFSLSPTIDTLGGRR
jgi:nitrate reductase delta subunit